MTDDQFASALLATAAVLDLAIIIWLFRKGHPWLAVIPLLLEIPLCIGVWFLTFAPPLRLF